MAIEPQRACLESSLLKEVGEETSSSVKEGVTLSVGTFHSPEVTDHEAQYLLNHRARVFGNLTLSR